jgi:antagonist of KipI
MSLVVTDPGLLTTVQDAGRFGYGSLGVPASGAMDTRSLTIANLLLGNDRHAAALEMTIVGPTLTVKEPTTLAVAGADLGGVTREAQRLLPGRSYRLEAGTTISFAGQANASRPDGSRAYLAVPGGVDVPVVLGSRSTCLAARFGGYDGRQLRTGDRIDPREPKKNVAPLLWPVDDTRASGAGVPRAIRIIAGPWLQERRVRPALDGLLGTAWTIATDSDRMGVRLEGPSIAAEGAGEVLSHGVPNGAIQLPPSGLPIILAADHQTTGGYPVLAVVASADHGLVGQLGPGDEVRFELVDVAAARRSLLIEAARFERLAAQLEEARRITEEVEWAGA